MSEQPNPEELKEIKETSLQGRPEETTETLPQKNPEAPGEPVSQGPQEAEWVPGEQLELIRIPPPTIWPATLALGTTGIAFGVVTHWILSAAGLFLFLLGAAGWIEDLRKDVL
jgi:hypothetical protein